MVIVRPVIHVMPSERAVAQNDKMVRRVTSSRSDPTRKEAVRPCISAHLLSRQRPRAVRYVRLSVTRSILGKESRFNL
jgi:hypothetical protein